MIDISQLAAKDIMNRDVHFIEEDAPVFNALWKMKEEGVSSLIVHKKNERDFFGIVTRKDLVTRVLAQGPEAQKLKVMDIMTKPALCAYPEMSIRHCLALMKLVGVRRLPIYDGKNIIGILSNTDIFNEAFKRLTAKGP